ncbi:hypothetical protein FB595_106178 [Sphingobium sp. AEW010]|nr:hypothetical protein [Sphingobium sp. JAI105]TWD07973.1 hypothetical protein FB595_106178 [Sphingobium sp. AEW010]TWD24755.1 hypothetical protein FB596_1065 [Sphingobium sp. AEW013]TWD26825.1 hypothetical protein FB594_106178 [Sphingobium sp. AEW001]
MSLPIGLYKIAFTSFYCTDFGVPVLHGRRGAVQGGH